MPVTSHDQTPRPAEAPTEAAARHERVLSMLRDAERLAAEVPKAAPREEQRAWPHDELTNLAQVLAHRLRGLVTSIEGFADLLAETLHTPDQREIALRVIEGTASIERILADLQRYGQCAEPVFRAVPVRSVVSETLAVLEEADAQRIALLSELPEAQHLTADTALLRQALLVLLQNALDAAPPEEAVRLRIWPDAPRSTIYFEVWNRGVIRLDEPAERLFEPFFTTKAQNLGVGLAIARRIASLHGGTVRLKTSSMHEGTSFVLALPVERGGPRGDQQQATGTLYTLFAGQDAPQQRAAG